MKKLLQRVNPEEAVVIKATASALVLLFLVIFFFT